MKRFLVALAIGGQFFLISIGPVSAATINLGAILNCAAANAGAGTCGAGGTGTGAGIMTLDDVTHQFDWNVSWSGLSGATTNAHFHGAANPNQNAGVQVPIDWTSNPDVGSAILNLGQEADLLAGLWYINIHSSTFGGGEIRGQANVVPIPAAVYLFGSALGLLGWMRRKTA